MELRQAEMDVFQALTMPTFVLHGVDYIILTHIPCVNAARVTSFSINM